MPIEIVDDEFHRIKMIVGGMPGSGKTRWASTWPNVVYADAEGRLLSVRDRKPRRWRIRSTKDLLDLKRALEQRPDVRETEFGGPVETVVIDTLDEVARIVQRERLDATGHETMQRDDWGAIKDTLAQIIRGFRNLDDVHVIFNVHLTTRDDEESGRSMVWPQIEGGMRTEVFNFVDISLLLTAKTKTDPSTGVKVLERRLQTLPDPRHEWIKDHSGSIPDGFEINFNDDWDRFATTIFGSVPPAARPATEIAKEREAENLEKVKEVKEALEDEETPAEPEAEPEAAEQPKVSTEDLEDDVAALRGRRRPSKTVAEAEPEAPQEPEAEPEPEPAPAPAEDDSTSEQADAEPEADAVAEPPVEETQPEPSVDEVAELKRKLAEAEAAARSEAPEPEPAQEAAEDLQRRIDEARAKAQANAAAREAEAPAGVDSETGEVVDPEALAADQAAVPEEGTTTEAAEEIDSSTGLHICEKCGEPIENEDVAELSFIRYQQHLCPEHFAERKKTKGRK